MTDIDRACEWADYRKSYAPAPLPVAHNAFCAGWDAAKGRRSFESVQAELAEDGRVSFYVAGVTAAVQSRTLSGEAVAYGGPVDDDNPNGTNVGLTSVGPLRVAARGQVVETTNGRVTARGLSWPDDLASVKLTPEHDRNVVRGYAIALVDSAERLRASFKATSDTDGDAAIAEAIDHKRDGFSIDTQNAIIADAADGGAPWLLSADLVAVGQVGLPAFYKGSRIDSVAASATTTPGKVPTVMTPEQRARLAELRAKNNRTTEEETEFSALADLAIAEASEPDEETPAETPAAPADAAPTAAVAASLVPGGLPSPRRRAPATTNESALDRFCGDLFKALNGDATALRDLRVSAALTDVTHSAHAGNIALPAWSGELWSGVQYEPEFIPLLNSGTLTSRKGQGWRWVTKPALADYAGDKAAIPTNTPDTELAEYTASRMAVGHDIDRAFYDFPDGAPFIKAYVEACRESWPVKLDAKVEAWIAANATDSGIDLVYDEPNDDAGEITTASAVMRAVGRAGRKVKRAGLGKATFVIMHDDLFDSLLNMTDGDVPAFLDLFGIKPENFTSSALAAFEDKVVVGSKNAATVRTLPGSPLRVSAQDIVKGGIDEAFFGYWAIEEHSADAIQYVDVTAGTPD